VIEAFGLLMNPFLLHAISQHANKMGIVMKLFFMYFKNNRIDSTLKRF
jgi:hypothetical protein